MSLEPEVKEIQRARFLEVLSKGIKYPFVEGMPIETIVEEYNKLKLHDERMKGDEKSYDIVTYLRYHLRE